MILNYTPPPTVRRFMLDDHFVRVIVGPLGSGKSMGCIMELLRRACLQEPYNGVRYTRFALVRNTLQQLKLTVLKDVQQYLEPIVRYFVSDSTIQIRTTLPDGTIMHSDWVMIPLDSPQDVRRLLSAQLTGAWINELREVSFEVVDGLLGRLGRYPSKALGGPTWHGLLADTNPWDTDSAYHKVCVLETDPYWALFHQPSGIGLGAENIENLPDGYYERLASGRNEEWAAVHVESQWGTSLAGQAVFRKSFHPPTHVRNMKIVTNPHRPLQVGLDFGRTPCALIGQIDSAGRALIFKEVVSDGVGLVKFIREYLKPVLFAAPFDGRRCFVVADPAGAQKSQLTEQTAFDILKEEGFLAYPAATNDIERRLTAVEKMLLSSVMGEPGLQINGTECPTLVHAMGNKYRYKKRQDGQLDDKPEKLHPWSDVADALQYFCLGTQANLVGRVMLRDRPRSGRQAIPAAAWT